MTIADPRTTAGMAVPTLPGQTLNAAWVNNVSNSVQRAVDGVGGGLVQPSPAIEFGGDGVIVSGPLVVSGAMTYSGDVAFSGDVTFGATATLTTNAATVTTLAGPITSSGANAWSGAQTFGSSVTMTMSPARTATRLQRNIKWNVTTSAVSYDALGLAPDDIAIQAIDLSAGQTLKSLTIYIDASTGGALPATRATIFLARSSLSGRVTMQSLVDPLNLLGTYRTGHELAFTLSPSVTVDPSSFTYYIGLVGESGANSQTIQWFGSKISADRSTLDIEG